MAITADTLLKVIQDFRLLLGEGNQRGNWRELFKQSAVKKSVELLQEKIEFLSEVIKIALGRSQTLDSIFERTESIKNQLIRLCDTPLLAIVIGTKVWGDNLVCILRHLLLQINLANS